MSHTPEFSRCAKGFERHGVLALKPVSDDHHAGSCPFCHKPKKFYINIKEVTWDCKVCGLSGNWYTFLKKISERNEKQLKGAALQELCRDRGLPPTAFRGIGIGWDGTQWTIPVEAQRTDGSAWFVSDIRTKVPGQNMMATPGARIALYGHREVAEADPKLPVYLCEGEWDRIALRFLLQLVGVSAVTCGVPGASIFKDEWLSAFEGRKVFTLYDADGPGETGELKAALKLHGVAKSVEYGHWPPSVPTGFDVRDWVRKGVVENRDPRGCWAELQRLFRPVPRRQDPEAWKALGMPLPSATPASAPAKGGIRRRKPQPTYVAHGDLYASYRRWLHMQSEDPLAVVFGTVLANHLIDGDPLWVFAVAPPGGMKSELLMSLSNHPDIYSVSTLSAASLCSGMVLPGGVDPSLIPKLDGKVLVVKDFTTTLTANPNERDEILGTLRDAYDGKFEKQFGNMPRPRRYESRFGILAGVTPTIDSYQSVSARLGERFLKYRLEREIDEADEEHRIRQAMTNVGRQAKMRESLCGQAAAFLESRLFAWKDREPIIPPETVELLVPLSVFTARLRGQVDRDPYRPDILKSRASREFGTRLSKQLTLLAQGIAVYFDEEVVTEDTYRLVAAVALGSVPDKSEEVVRAIWAGTRIGGSVSASEITRRCRGISASTVLRELQDLQLLEVVQKIGTGTTSTWQLEGKFQRLVDRSRVFELVASPISLRKKRVIRRRKQTPVSN